MARRKAQNIMDQGVRGVKTVKKPIKGVKKVKTTRKPFKKQNTNIGSTKTKKQLSLYQKRQQKKQKKTPFDVTKWNKPFDFSTNDEYIQYQKRTGICYKGEKIVSTSSHVLSKSVTNFLNWCCCSLGIDNSSVKHLSKLITFLSNIELNRGKKLLVLTVKEIRMVLENYLAGSPLKRGQTLYNRLSYSGLPVTLGPLSYQIKTRNTKIITFVFSFLSVTKVIKVKSSPNYSSITDEYRGKLCKNDVPKNVLFSFKLELKKLISKDKNYRFRQPVFDK